MSDAAAADTAALRELAEKATRWQPNTSWSRGNPEREFADEVSPAVILALVAELSALRAARDETGRDLGATASQSPVCGSAMIACSLPAGHEGHHRAPAGQIWYGGALTGSRDSASHQEGGPGWEAFDAWKERAYAAEAALTEARAALEAIRNVPCEHGYDGDERDNCGCGSCFAVGVARAVFPGGSS